MGEARYQGGRARTLRQSRVTQKHHHKDMEALQKEIEDTLKQSEILEEDILTSQEQLQNLEAQHKVNEDAIKELTKTKELKVWICTSDMFISFPKNSTAGVLKNQQKIIEKETDKQKKNLKQNSEKLEKLNNKPLSV
eukprot:Phypoly_transcript_27476.p1 GENE.Phypoly_transcript_27476~~Phypoly_transcript_27476.p1  ORF type:complete len:137 (+),score=28.37 Phypoly_transcript_27476:62-472(+)